MDWTRIERDQHGVQYVKMDEATAAIAQATPPPAWIHFPEISGWVVGLGGILALILGMVALGALLAMMFRIVVSTNEVHIVQSGKRTVSYGKDQPAGNTYYKWPAWVPVIGVKTSILPMSVFDLNLDGYAAYDKGRVPFMIDAMAFFRIEDSNVAAQRVHSFDDLISQLRGILQGAIRTILAKAEIETILEERAKFGTEFTVAVEEQLKAWGVVNVKNIELMDIRDGENSQVIANIMAKKKSLIEKESRIAVAENLRAAKEAEIEAKRQVDLSAQQAEQVVGERTAAKEQAVGIAQQKADQAIQEEAALTATKVMMVRQIEAVRAAEIQRDAVLVAAEQEKKQTITLAEGHLQKATLDAQGVEIQGRAEGEAKKAVLLAPVQAQITLAEKIAELEEYQSYLVSIETIKKDQAVGIAQAVALQAAKIQVIANSGSVVGGVENVMDLFTTKGGTSLGGAVEAFAQTTAGKAILGKLVE